MTLPLAAAFLALAAAQDGFERPVSYSHENTFAVTGAAGGALASVFGGASGSGGYGGAFGEAGFCASLVERGELRFRARGGGGTAGPLLALLAGYRVHVGEEWKTYFAVDVYGPLLPQLGLGLRAAVGAIWDQPSWGLYAEAGVAAALGPRQQGGADLSVGVELRWPR